MIKEVLGERSTFLETKGVINPDVRHRTLKDASIDISQLRYSDLIKNEVDIVSLLFVQIV